MTSGLNSGPWLLKTFGPCFNHAHDEEGQILKAYNLGVACYITKPIDVAKLMIAVCSIPQFQVTVVTTSPPR
jgi:DNA-binding NarL/FixJ family response regulator